MPGRVPGLLVPMLRADGSTWGYQYRPDDPRLRGGKPVKYETPWQQRNGLDVPPGVGAMLGDPAIPLWITEGVKKADCGALHGLCIVGLTGVWGWLGTNSAGGKMALADWHDVALNGRRVIIAFDGDMARKEPVQKAAHAPGRVTWRTKGARVEYLHLPDTDDKTGLDDYLMAGHTVEDLWTLVKPNQPPVRQTPEEPPPTRRAADEPAQPISLTEAHTVFHRWLGEDYDTDALDACWPPRRSRSSTTAATRCGCWSSPGPAPPRPRPCRRSSAPGPRSTSSISCEAALLSATPEARARQERHRRAAAPDGRARAAGRQGRHLDPVHEPRHPRQGARRAARGLRRPLGPRGRGRGRAALPGTAASSSSARSPPPGTPTTRSSPRWATGSCWCASTPPRPGWPPDARPSATPATRRRCAPSWPTAVAGVIAGMNPEPITLTDDETDVLLAAADLVTRARTGVEYDYRGNVIDAHAPECQHPVRQAARPDRARGGRDRHGPQRRAAAGDPVRPRLHAAAAAGGAELPGVHPGASTLDVRRGLDKPRATVDRGLQALHVLGLVTRNEVSSVPKDGKEANFWNYFLADGVDPGVLVGKKDQVTAGSSGLDTRQKQPSNVSGKVT